MRKPSLSVILGMKDAAETVHRAIQSIAEQKNEQVQIIVIDGASTDGTLDILAEFKDSIDVLISEADSCYAEAWNKGLAQAKGDLVALLNADDYLPEGQVQYILSKADPNARSLYYGDVIEIDRHSGKPLSHNKGQMRTRLLHFGLGFMHTTCIVPRQVYEEIGSFDESYRFAADTNWLLRCKTQGIRFEYLGNQICMSAGGLTDQHYIRSFDEYLRALREQGFSPVMISAAKLYSRAKYFISRTRKH